MIEPLGTTHERREFSCGHLLLDDFLKKYASQNQRMGVSRSYVALFPGESIVRGYYSIAAGSALFENVPEEHQRRLPRYPIPTAHLGRLAVDTTCRGQRLGEGLLLDALSRIAQAGFSIAIHAVEVVAIDEAARGFCLRYGFTPMSHDRRHLYLPISKLNELGLV